MKINTKIKIKTGSLLIAPPKMPDKRFTETVNLVTHYGKDNAFALCTNVRTSLFVTNITTELGIKSCDKIPIYWGGPVDPNTIWMVHDSNWSCKGTAQCNEKWSLSSSTDMIYEIANNNRPEYYRIFSGHCAWGKDQLNREIAGKSPFNKNNAWLIADNPGLEWLFKTKVDSLWYESTLVCAEQTVKHWL